MKNLFCNFFAKIGVRIARIDVLRSEGYFCVRMKNKFMCDNNGCLIKFETSDEAQQAGVFYWIYQNGKNAQTVGFNSWTLLEQPVDVSLIVESPNELLKTGPCTTPRSKPEGR
ncbi:hypothetical protein [Methylicorpusculum sp.]|uniref:hypothetical protein n=1 Tax=Methylicorpusculum sp. TaxID=2713644 RepID=UPI002ABB7A57|nr:hypothetical protein [Methylicorpusculum sp.]MDZ4150934.1 hypothetical protein [Methylicorpusculum sp.]